MSLPVEMSHAALACDIAEKVVRIQSLEMEISRLDKELKRRDSKIAELEAAMPKEDEEENVDAS